mmetsp:Transcript_2870/g.8721  ORF Transcript_2870/g.8721 Transcript_2870/m.8721 type:complete len:373 (-) Transcript_2870:174-1292(-)
MAAIAAGSRASGACAAAAALPFFVAESGSVLIAQESSSVTAAFASASAGLTLVLGLGLGLAAEAGVRNKPSAERPTAFLNAAFLALRWLTGSVPALSRRSSASSSAAFDGSLPPASAASVGLTAAAGLTLSLASSATSFAASATCLAAVAACFAPGDCACFALALTRLTSLLAFIFARSAAAAVCFLGRSGGSSPPALRLMPCDNAAVTACCLPAAAALRGLAVGLASSAVAAAAASSPHSSLISLPSPSLSMSKSSSLLSPSAALARPAARLLPRPGAPAACCCGCCVGCEGGALISSMSASGSSSGCGALSCCLGFVTLSTNRGRGASFAACASPAPAPAPTRLAALVSSAASSSLLAASSLSSSCTSGS